MNNNYDMEGLYLYKSYSGYRIGQIEKVNEKTMRMEWDTRIPKDEFNKIYKLTEEEASIYRGELIKRLSVIHRETKSMIETLNKIRVVLRSSEFVALDTDKLHSKIDELTHLIEQQLPSRITINGDEFEFCDYTSDRLEKIEE